ncbi:hypothetical protein AVEN_250815-1 [Araneus ventricosus]|uniref:Uncharacterized protein n=1 Tax=Araneus ventricosus TaxID=182803 RepID=A0A4Y2MQA6_ARAVE|nr:hypothetical protein AVEN_250815-1 [Araneus ventricosus]
MSQSKATSSDIDFTGVWHFFHDFLSSLPLGKKTSCDCALIFKINSLEIWDLFLFKGSRSRIEFPQSQEKAKDAILLSLGLEGPGEGDFTNLHLEYSIIQRGTSHSPSLKIEIHRYEDSV